MPDDSGFADFVAARHRALVRSAYLLVGDRGHAEDLVQEALFRTYQSWGRLREVTAAQAYARTTLVRLAARASRRRWTGELPAESPDARASDARDHDLALDLRTALSRLPYDQRATLVLRYFDDLSEADTAAALACSVGTVKSRASRALAALRSAGLIDVEVSDG